MFVEISQNSQKSTCAKVFLLIKLQASGLQLYKKRESGTGVFLWIWPATLSKKKLWHRCFPVNFAKFLIAPFLQNTSRRLLLVFAQNRSSGLYFFVLWFVHSLIMILLCSVRACNIKYLIFTQNLKQPDCSHIMLLASRNKINRWSWKQLWPSITRPRYYAFNWVY